MNDFQNRVHVWLIACFGHRIAHDQTERNQRFLEEVLELTQACGCTASEAHQLVDYVFGRPIGRVGQEVGGVMVTLAALCCAQQISMDDAAYMEWARIEEPETMAKLRAKQAARPRFSPLPAPSPEAGVKAKTTQTPVSIGTSDRFRDAAGRLWKLTRKGWRIVKQKAAKQ